MTPTTTRERPTRPTLGSGRADPVAVVTVILLLLFAISQRYVVESLGPVGSPASLASLAAAGWWATGWATGGLPGSGHQPVRLFVLVFWAAALSGYAAAWFRPLLAVEGRATDRTLLQWVAYGGLALLIADGVASRDRLEVLLRRLVHAGAALALAGIVQFVAGADPARWVALPLHFNAPEAGLIQNLNRGPFVRVAATTLHPIEFGVVLASILPLAVANAVTHLERPAWRRWTPLVLVGLAIPLAISRSAIVGLVVGATWLVPALPSSSRFRLGVAGAATVIATTFAWPGLLGTLRSAFFRIQTDTSFTARTNDYGLLERFVAERPLLGRGLGTFVPRLYDFLDNQYLLTLIEAGFVGLGALVTLIVGSVGVSRRITRHSTDPATAVLARALGASVLVHATAFATYDGLTFPTASSSFFVVIGSIGALWRLTARSGAA